MNGPTRLRVIAAGGRAAHIAQRAQAILHAAHGFIAAHAVLQLAVNHGNRRGRRLLRGRGSRRVRRGGHDRGGGGIGIVALALGRRARRIEDLQHRGGRGLAVAAQADRRHERRNGALRGGIVIAGGRAAEIAQIAQAALHQAHLIAARRSIGQVGVFGRAGIRAGRGRGEEHLLHLHRGHLALNLQPRRFLEGLHGGNRRGIIAAAGIGHQIAQCLETGLHGADRLARGVGAQLGIGRGRVRGRSGRLFGRRGRRRSRRGGFRRIAALGRRFVREEQPLHLGGRGVLVHLQPGSRLEIGDSLRRLAPVSSGRIAGHVAQRAQAILHGANGAAAARAVGQRRIGSRRVGLRGSGRRISRRRGRGRIGGRYGSVLGDRLVGKEQRQHFGGGGLFVGSKAGGRLEIGDGPGGVVKISA